MIGTFSTKVCLADVLFPALTLTLTSQGVPGLRGSVCGCSRLLLLSILCVFERGGESIQASFTFVGDLSSMRCIDWCVTKHGQITAFTRKQICQMFLVSLTVSRSSQGLQDVNTVLHPLPDPPSVALPPESVALSLHTRVQGGCHDVCSLIVAGSA